MTNPLLRSIDQGLGKALRLVKRLPVADPSLTGLAGHREDVAARLHGEYAHRVAALAEAVVGQDPEATRRYDGLMEAAMTEMRAARPAGPRAPLAAVDRLLYDNRQELIDDPSFPEAERVHVIECVDWLNRQLGSYRRWVDFLLDLVELAERRGAGPVQIYDLAAGHGGFALALQERLGARAEVTATDLFEAYLALGRQKAAAQGSPVRFALQDATDLRGLRGAGVDLFLCTQSLHHFPPGMVARIFGQAAACARAGVCFIDGERSLLPLLILPALMGARGRTWPVFHDTWVSLRRMYLAEELGLLARLAPGLPAGAQVEAQRVAPGYAVVRVVVP